MDNQLWIKTLLHSAPSSNLLLIAAHLVVSSNNSWALARMRLLCVQLLLIFVIHIKGKVVAQPRPSKIRPRSNTLQPPEITLANSDQLFIDCWTKSFDGCKSSQVLNAFVQFQRSNVLKVSFTANKASVRANPCLPQREISVILKYQEPIQSPTNVVTREIRSLSENYN